MIFLIFFVMEPQVYLETVALQAANDTKQGVRHV